MNTKSQAPNRPIDEVLASKDFDSIFAKHKVSIIGLVLLLIGSVAGLGVYQQQAEKKGNAFAGEIYKFRTDSLQAYRDKKIKIEDLNQQILNLKSSIGAHKALYLTLLEVSDLMLSEKKVEMATPIVEFAYSNYSEPYMKYLAGMRLAVVYENQGKIDEAISILEGLSSSNLKLSEGKVYLDLGRLYMAQGQTDKARSSLQYVVDNLNQKEIKSMARIYLSQLGAK